VAEISVRDQGEGIPPEKLSQIFDPFFTTKQHGTGLGLPAVLGIVERHEGTIDVSSDEGVGTIVTFTLPLARSVHPADADHDMESFSEEATPTTAAILTEDEDLLDEIEEMMTNVGIHLLSGPSLANIDEDYTFPQKFSLATLVVFDLDGWTGSFESAVELVRERFPFVMLIALSSSPTSLAEIRKMEGRVSCLRKPIVQSQLNSRLAAIGTAVER
jgi:hypothetical protein